MMRSGVQRRPLPSFLLGIVLLFMMQSGFADGISPDGVFLAFATWDQIFMGVGKYEPKTGWTDYHQFQIPYQPGQVFTLYRMDGEVAQVTDQDEFRNDPRHAPVEWSASIGRWYKEGKGEPFALAVPGVSPLKSEPARSLPLDDVELQKRVSDYLKKQYLHVDKPLLTQAYEVTLSSGGLKGILISAHSDASAMKDNKSGAVYAVILLQIPQDGQWKTFMLQQQKSFKPAFRSIDEQERLFGKRDFYRVIACLDINGDGWKEIVTYGAEERFGSEVDIFEFDGRRVNKLLAAFKHLYN
jgi:hypothetical protein